MPEIKYPNRRYVVGGRNGYYGIDEYTEKGCLRMIDSFKTNKQASATARDLASAHRDGMMDALVGLKLPILKDGEKYNRATGHYEVTVPKGTVVLVLTRDGAFFDCVDDKGNECSMTYPALRQEITVPHSAHIIPKGV